MTTGASPIEGIPDRRLARPRGGVLRLSRLSWHVDVRSTVVCSLVSLVILAMFAVTMSVGDFDVAPSRVIPAVFGQADGFDDYIVHALRLPRALAALMVGAAFGLSGAITQSVAGNPLASPDIIGVTAGASAAAVTAIAWLHAGSSLEISLGALAGGLICSTLMYALAYRRGISAYRMVLIGIGLSAMFMALTSYVLTRAEITDVQRAFVWLTGSLNGQSWEQVRLLGLAMLALAPLALAMGRPLRMLEMGEDAAKALGLRVERTRLGLILVAVLLAAMATATAGPIAFVALAAPQIARRLTRSPGASLLPSATVGAALVLCADYAAHYALSAELPVGIATSLIGGPYLLWLLMVGGRRLSGASA